MNLMLSSPAKRMEDTICTTFVLTLVSFTKRYKRRSGQEMQWAEVTLCCFQQEEEDPDRGQPCMRCGDQCPGFRLHGWRYRLPLPYTLSALASELLQEVCAISERDRLQQGYAFFCWFGNLLYILEATRFMSFPHQIRKTVTRAVMQTSLRTRALQLLPSFFLTRQITRD